MTDETPEAPRPDPRRRHGLIIVNTGDGKGKTTAALGLAFRA
ncbi:MAG: cob(I)yrinic acid a,c-diamide adenosyltransferase, partial [Planctomycetaceae bacterium]|nr:cob(I)yrinic acid a,c-diamide adenosyltransferase [Planctomycetaceae bacterium]